MPGFVAKDVLDVIQALLPGFVTAWVFFGLTAYKTPNAFERTVQALIFTMFVQVLVLLFGGLLVYVGERTRSLGDWSQNVQLIWSVVIAILLGLVFASLANNNTIHRQLICRTGLLKLVDENNQWAWTKQSAYPSEWFRAFNEGPAWIVLHLHDERRIYGKSLEWPNSPDSGHFLLSEADWLTMDEGKTVVTPIGNVWATLIPASDVRFVDFVQASDESTPKSKIEE